MNKWHVTAVVLLCFIWGGERGITGKPWELTCDLCCPQSCCHGCHSSAAVSPVGSISPAAHQPISTKCCQGRKSSQLPCGSWCYLSAIVVLSSVLRSLKDELSFVSKRYVCITDMPPSLSLCIYRLDWCIFASLSSRWTWVFCTDIVVIPWLAAIFVSTVILVHTADMPCSLGCWLRDPMKWMTIGMEF